MGKFDWFKERYKKVKEFMREHPFIKKSIILGATVGSYYLVGPMGAMVPSALEGVLGDVGSNILPNVSQNEASLTRWLVDNRPGEMKDIFHNFILASLKSNLNDLETLVQMNHDLGMDMMDAIKQIQLEMTHVSTEIISFGQSIDKILTYTRNFIIPESKEEVLRRLRLPIDLDHFFYIPETFQQSANDIIRKASIGENCCILGESGFGKTAFLFYLFQELNKTKNVGMLLPSTHVSIGHEREGFILIYDDITEDPYFLRNLVKIQVSHLLVTAECREWYLLPRDHQTSFNVFELPPFPPSHLQAILQKMLETKGVQVERGMINTIVQNSNGAVKFLWEIVQELSQGGKSKKIVVPQPANTIYSEYSTKNETFQEISSSTNQINSIPRKDQRKVKKARCPFCGAPQQPRICKFCRGERDCY